MVLLQAQWVSRAWGIWGIALDGSEKAFACSASPARKSGGEHYSDGARDAARRREGLARQ
jgi:hypothetical protein